MLAKSHSTTAAVRQYEMKVNVTLLMTITWAARRALAAGERPFAEGVAELVISGGETGPVESFCTAGGNPGYLWIAIGPFSCVSPDDVKRAKRSPQQPWSKRDQDQAATGAATYLCRICTNWSDPSHPGVVRPLRVNPG